MPPSPQQPNNLPIRPAQGFNLPPNSDFGDSKQTLRQGEKLRSLNQQMNSQLPFKRVYYKTLKRGSLIQSQYTFWRHDPFPLILVTDVFPDKIRGINLHYLTLKYVKTLLANNCGNSGFSYRMIKFDPYIVNAFRTYKKAGLRSIQLLDCDLINLQFQNSRQAFKYNPQELKAIRDILKQQLQKVANPRANDMVNPTAPDEQLAIKNLPNHLQDAARRNYVQYLGRRSATIPGLPTRPATR